MKIKSRREPSSVLFLSIADCVALSAFSKSKVRRAIDAGELRAYRHGGNVRVKPEDLQAWVDRAEPLIPKSA